MTNNPSQFTPTVTAWSGDWYQEACALAVQGGSAMLPKLLNTSKQFNPWLYLGTVHADTSREQLEAGLACIDDALAKRKDQLRQLVKENFQRFIGCKGTIDDISLRLKARSCSFSHMRRAVGQSACTCR
jgi:hypothetical protein